jgi:hypothetical protein
MSKSFCLIAAITFIAVFITQPVIGQKVTISGYISDTQSGERLVGATVFHPASGTGAISNQYGFFSISVPVPVRSLEFGFVGYGRTALELASQSDTVVNILLQPNLMIGEVTVKGNTGQHHGDLSPLSQITLNLKEMEKAPVVLGERDIIKTLQYLPGIKGGSENTANFNVRGGSPDQNLILLDGVPVYNVNHLMGFFSVFNTDAIKNVSLYKGGIPARYGGRVSSVLDVVMKEGNLQKNSGSVSVSPVAGSFTFEAPLKKDTGSFLVSLRRTYFDLPLRAIQKINSYDQNFGYYFYDFNAKANWIFNPGSRLYLSFYAGKDELFHRSSYDGYNTKSSYHWGNATSVLRWNKILSPRLFTNISAYYSHFTHQTGGRFESGGVKTIFINSSNLNELSLNSDWEFYSSPTYTVRFGTKVARMDFKPNIVQMKNAEADTIMNKQFGKHALTTEAYIENSFRLNRININAGTRMSAYKVGEKIYGGIQPRLSASLNMGISTQISASYTHTIQYLHMLSNSELGLPTDLWVASTETVKPQTGDQITLGASGNLHDGYTFGIEGYYKWLHKVTRFDEGVMFLNTTDTNWEENILSGNGRAYGIETMVNKTEGKITGMASYTLSWSERRFNAINAGKWFPFEYDRRHDFSVLANYQFRNSKYREKSFTFGFTLQSGNRLSLPDTETDGYILPGGEIDNYKGLKEWYSTRHTYAHPNNFKMPAFHHLDIGYNTTRRQGSNKSYSWNFSVYNVYNRMNPWYYYKDNHGKIRQVSIFPIIPSVGFTYKW